MKKNRFLIYSTIMILIASVTTFTFGAEKLDLKKCQDLAMQNSNLYKAALADELKNEAGLKGAKADYWYPSLSTTLSGAYMKVKQQNESAFVKYPKYSLSGEVALTKAIYAGGALSAQVDLNKESLNLSKIQTLKIKRLVLKAVRLLYYQVQLYQAAFDVSNDAYKMTKKLYENAKINYEAGLLDKLNFLQLEITFLESETPLNDAKTSLATAKNDLLNAIGKEPIEKSDNRQNDIDVIGNLEKIAFNKELAEIRKKCMANRIELKELRKQNEILIISEDLARSSYKPTVALFATYKAQYTEELETTIFPPEMAAALGMGPVEPSKSGGLEQTITAGVQIQFDFSDIFPGSKSFSEVDKVKAQRKALNQSKKNTIKDTNVLITKNYLNLKKFEREINITNRIIKASKENLDIATKQFEAGKIDFFTYRQVEISYNSIRFKQLQNIFNYNIAIINLLDMMGEPL